MSKSRYYYAVVLGVVLLALLAVGCGGSGPAVSTATSVPPTATTAPTDTPAPTATLVVASSPTTSTTGTSGGSGAGAGGASLADALAKAKEATTYRMDMQMTGKGSGFSLNLSGTPEAGASNQEVALMSVKGEVSGKDSHVIMQGLLAAFLGVDPNKGLELITVGGKSYVHGPAALLGATEDKWYEMPADQAQAAQPPLKPSTLLESFSGSGMNPADFKKSGTETLDNQSCDVYSGDKDVVAKAMKSTGGVSGTTQQFENLDTAELQFWVCNDGFFHQMRMFVEGSTKEKPNEKGSFLILMHLSDIGGNITITAPSSAEPLKMPSFFGSGTPTP